MEETKNIHPNKKTRLIFFKKLFVCKEQKKLKKIENWIWAGGGASGERPRPAAACAASPTGPAAPPAPAPPPARESRRRSPLSGRMEQKERGKGAPWSRRDPDGGRGKNVCIGKERRSAEDKVALAPRTWMEKKIDYVTVDLNFSIGNEHTCLNSTSAPFFPEVVPLR